jgi:hypothetical protein
MINLSQVLALWPVFAPLRCAPFAYQATMHPSPFVGIFLRRGRQGPLGLVRIPWTVLPVVFLLRSDAVQDRETGESDESTDQEVEETADEKRLRLGEGRIFSTSCWKVSEAVEGSASESELLPCLSKPPCSIATALGGALTSGASLSTHCPHK